MVAGMGTAGMQVIAPPKQYVMCMSEIEPLSIT
jgi:hypothetical protein